MKQGAERIGALISEKRVKLHVFEPSQRTVWTVVGKGKEHWLDPDAEFCSCPGYYFGKLSGKKSCYHLESAHLAKKESQYERIIFSDDEYVDFLASLISDL